MMRFVACTSGPSHVVKGWEDSFMSRLWSMLVRFRCGILYGLHLAKIVYLVCGSYMEEWMMCVCCCSLVSFSLM